MNERTAVGIQISDTGLTEAELRRTTDRQVEVVRLERVAVDARAADARAIDRGESINSATPYVAGLSGPDVLSRCWSLPNTDAERLRRIVGLRVEADLPVSADQLTWAYRVTDAPSGAGRDHHDVLVQAVRTERMHHHLDTLSAVGIGTNIVTTEAEAVGALYRHGLRNTDPDATEVLILADADRWITAVISGGMVRSLRRLRSDANNFEQTCRDCQQSIASAGSLSDVRRVWWCGGAALDAARSRLAELLGVPVEPVDIGISRQRQSTTSSGSIGPEHLATYGPAIGLALAGLFERDEILRLYDRAAADRAPRASRLERVMSYPWRWAGVAAVFTMLAAVMHVGALYGEVRNMQHLIDQAGNVPVTNKLGDAPELEPKIRALSRLEAYRIDVERIVAALCLFTPDSIIISSLSISREKRMTLKGTAQDAKAIFTLTEALENDSRFNAVTPEQTAAGKEKTFTLTAELPGVTKLTTATGRGASWR